MTEYDVYIDIISAFKNEKLFFNKKHIKKMIYNYLKFYNIDSLSVKKIKFNRKCQFNYSKRLKLLNLDCTSDLFGKFINNEDSILQMINILSSIFHELVHVEDLQKEKVFDNDFLNKQFKLSFDYIFNNKTKKYEAAKKYDDFGPSFIFEYHADIESYIKFENLYLNYLKQYIEESIIEKNNESRISEDLLDFYKNYEPHNFSKSYPLLNNKLLCNIDDKDFEKNIERLTKYYPNELDRLKLGLPIKDTTLEYLTKVADGKVKTYKLFNDIKNME